MLMRFDPFRELDTEKIGATYTDGVLRLTTPVPEQAKARRIAVSGSGEPPSVGASATA